MKPINLFKLKLQQCLLDSQVGGSQGQAFAHQGGNSQVGGSVILRLQHS